MPLVAPVASRPWEREHGMHGCRREGRFVSEARHTSQYHQAPASGAEDGGWVRHPHNSKFKFQNRKAGVAHAVVVALALVASLVPAGIAPVAAAQPACRAFGEFAVCARFLDEWSKQGNDQAGVYVNGLPITGRRPELSLTDGKLYDTQWFERARYEAHPENSAPYDVLLGRLGASLVDGRGRVDPYSR